jgi:hypothetical protein
MRKPKNLGRLALNKRSGRPRLKACDAQNMGHNRPHAVGFPIRLPYTKREGLVLYPHFTNKIVPGWLDKMLPWRSSRGARGGRGAQGEWLDNVVLISPSREYLARLPLGKLPDRGDFTRFVDDYEGRLKNWRFAMEESARLRDELAELIASGEIATRLKPL